MEHEVGGDASVSWSPGEEVALVISYLGAPTDLRGGGWVFGADRRRVDGCVGFGGW